MRAKEEKLPIYNMKEQGIFYNNGHCDLYNEQCKHYGINEFENDKIIIIDIDFCMSHYS